VLSASPFLQYLLRVCSPEWKDGSTETLTLVFARNPKKKIPNRQEFNCTVNCVPCPFF
jgi:hypothetical protein